jgi:DNA-binding NarL/FixJ family response regulator
MKGNRGFSILLIDGSAVVRGVLKRLLKVDSRVHHFFVASNAADGYSLFKISRPDVVVLDLDLPDLHGLEILKLIKGVARKCAVMILTNSDTQEMRELCVRHGADAFMSKEADLIVTAGEILAFCASHRNQSRSGKGNEGFQDKGCQYR